MHALVHYHHPACYCPHWCYRARQTGYIPVAAMAWHSHTGISICIVSRVQTYKQSPSWSPVQECAYASNGGIVHRTVNRSAVSVLPSIYLINPVCLHYWIFFDVGMGQGPKLWYRGRLHPSHTLPSRLILGLGRTLSVLYIICFINLEKWWSLYRQTWYIRKMN